MSSKRSLVAVMAAVLMALAACNATPPVSPNPTGMPGDVAEDGLFRLVLVIPKLDYPLDEAITPVARLISKGPDASVKIFHGSPSLVWRIAQVGGGRTMDGVVEDVCESTEIAAGDPIVVPFRKSGEIGGPDHFDLAWMRDPVLTLPPGTWQISVTSEISTGDCGGEPHRLTAEVEVVVREGVSAMPSG